MPEQFMRIGGSDGTTARGLRTDSVGVLQTKPTNNVIVDYSKQIEVTSGATTWLTDIVITQPTYKIIVLPAQGFPTHAYDVDGYHSIDNLPVMDSYEFHNSSGVHGRFITENQETLTPYLNLRIRNRNNETRTYTVIVISTIDSGEPKNIIEVERSVGTKTLNSGENLVFARMKRKLMNLTVLFGKTHGAENVEVRLITRPSKNAVINYQTKRNLINEAYYSSVSFAKDEFGIFYDVVIENKGTEPIIIENVQIIETL